MKKIAIIGCGSSAMILGHSLLAHGGYEVVVFSEKTARQWAAGPPTGTPFVAGENIDIERELALEHWEDTMFFGDGVMLDFRASRDTEPPYRPRALWQTRRGSRPAHARAALDG